MKIQSGFTIPELMATLAVAGILAALAAPSFTDFIANERLRSAANDMVAMMFTARTEAIKRNRRVTVCKLSTTGANECTAANCACDATAGNDWSNGWMSFVDDNSDGSLTAGEEVLQIAWAPRGSTEVDPLAADATVRNYISFLPRGNVRQTTADGGGIQSGTFRLCDERGLNYGRAVVLDVTGRARTIGPQNGSVALIGACP
ncbi:MAG: GspH/FimT family pseudopilin [Pseudomonadota bacterium]